MFKTLKTIAAELKRANDLKERDIKNIETWGWYINSTSVQTGPEVGNVRYSGMPGGYTVTTAGGR